MFCFVQCCRLCLTKDETLINYNKCDIDGITYLHKLAWIMPTLLLSTPKQIPTKICIKCQDQLHLTYKFMQNCFKTRQLLEKYCLQLKSVATDSNDVNYTLKVDVSEFYNTEIKDLHSLSHLNKIIIKQELNDEIIVPEIELEEEECFNTQLETVVVKNEPIDSELLVPCEPPQSPIENSNLTLSDEQLIIRENDKFKCSICLNTYSRLRYVRKHYRSVHNQERPYKCKLCDKKFSQLPSLQYHEKAHLGIKEHKCNICEKAFILNKSLRYHMNTVHLNENTKTYNCHLCEAYFGNLSALSRHIGDHEKQAISSTASINETDISTFNTKNESTPIINLEPKQNLMSEGNVHNYSASLSNLLSNENSKQNKVDSPSPCKPGKRKYKCYLCSEVFSSPLKLGKHAVIHPKPYKCQCNRTFNFMYLLERHYLTAHNDERLFSCNICSKTFKNKIHVYNHKRNVHMKKGECQCPFCKQIFSQRYTLKEHIKHVHPEESLICEFCDEEFNDENIFLKHRDVCNARLKRNSTYLPISTVPVNVSESIIVETINIKETQVFNNEIEMEEIEIVKPTTSYFSSPSYSQPIYETSTENQDCKIEIVDDILTQD